MEQKKRRHHYLPRYYLGGFTQGGDKADPLFVRSKKQNRSWTTRAEGAAHKRDLFKPEGAQFEPDEFEDGFASIEGLIAPVLKGAIKTEILPDIHGLGLLLHLVALNAARPPAEIAHLEDIVDENLRRGVADDMTVEVHQRILDEWRAEGRDTTHVEDLDALKERILKGGVRAVMPRDYTLVMGVLGRATVLIDLLALRGWTLLRVESPDLHFVCSDRPVNLLNNRNLPEGTPARFNDPRFDVIMPLSKRLCMVGRPDRVDGTAAASKRTVGFINHITETGANDYIYAAAQGYVVSPDSEFSRENAEAYRRDLRAQI